MSLEKRERVIAGILKVLRDELAHIGELSCRMRYVGCSREELSRRIFDRVVDIEYEERGA